MHKRHSNPIDERHETVLVVGDWFVDEHWVCGVHRSSSSSRTGQAHLRALHANMSCVQAFCGAGRTASFLHQLYRTSTDNCSRSVTGLGFWHRADTPSLKSLFDLKALPQNLYRLTTPSLKDPHGVVLINMNDALNSNLTDAQRDATEYTTRIIRIYRRAKDDRIVYERLDWEPDPQGRVVWDENKLTLLSRSLEEALQNKVVRAVMIKDLNKGAISKKIVEWLVSRETLRSAHWYISTKRWRPDWLSLLSEIQPALFMVPQVAAQAAVRQRELSCWLTRSGRPSNEAIGLIDELVNKTRARRLLLLPEGFRALAWQQNDECVVQSERRPEPITVEMGSNSIAFPAFVACVESPSLASKPLDEIVSLSLRTAYEWVEAEAQRTYRPVDWKPVPADWQRQETFKAIQKASQGSTSLGDFSVRPFGKTQNLSWDRERTDWEEALKDLGIINKPGNRRELQLWRAMIELDDYVCCGEPTRKRLRELVQQIHSFAKAPRHHAGCMLVASPGSGKTFLARRLADNAGLRFLPFNITQMRSKGDLLECFDAIVAAQAEGDDERNLLVFVDEINAELDGDPVYGAFLTALEDGTYVHSGKIFHIRPCIWVFAGTKNPKEEGQSSEKGSDFVSRLTLGVVNLGEATETQQETEESQRVRRLELVYLGASLVAAEFPDVHHVSEPVLHAFSTLSVKCRVRDIKHFVRRFSDVQYGRVTSSNVPLTGWPDDEAGNSRSSWSEWLEAWKASHEREGADIEIVGSHESTIRSFDDQEHHKPGKPQLHLSSGLRALNSSAGGLRSTRKRKKSA